MNNFRDAQMLTVSLTFVKYWIEGINRLILFIINGMNFVNINIGYVSKLKAFIFCILEQVYKVQFIVYPKYITACVNIR